MKINDNIESTADNDVIATKKGFVHKTLEQRVKESGLPLTLNVEYDFGDKEYDNRHDS